MVIILSLLILLTVCGTFHRTTDFRGILHPLNLGVYTVNENVLFEAQRNFYHLHGENYNLTTKPKTEMENS